MTSAVTLLRSLCRSNGALLRQKVGLLDALTARHGPDGLAAATEVFTKPCPIVGSSIGQHLRHSMDHMELAALVAEARLRSAYDAPADAEEPAQIHYDLRVRGGTLETDMAESRKRIVAVENVLEGIHDAVAAGLNGVASHIVHGSVHASFYLSSDDAEDREGESSESALPSTVGRELGFAAHHAIHHLAMVRVIALHSAGLEEEDLPPDFGRAPSTVRYANDPEIRRS
mmetsp:Transcript_19672/g.46507  ORF Transcript_19672/g.46507 Transcript_19672/m.46507 type:complete len:229 (+) Transcript_19672:111-797(+)